MIFKDAGCFFIKKKDKSIWIVIYSKTNHILKKYPNIKLMYFDMKTKQFKEKNHSPNKIWGVFFDNKGRDYVMDKDVSYKEMEKMITKDSQEIYDFEDSDLYEKMKETGVDKFYTKKWFKTKIDFVKRATGYYKIKWFWTVIYTGEDLKWDTPSGCHFKSLPISRQAIQHPSDAYGPYRSLGELKCPILILQWCKII
jgi:hypothetical protein